MQLRIVPIKTLPLVLQYAGVSPGAFPLKLKRYSSVSLVHFNQQWFTKEQIFQLLVLKTVFSSWMEDIDKKSWLSEIAKLKKREQEG